jgi:hypothetical protein
LRRAVDNTANIRSGFSKLNVRVPLSLTPPPVSSLPTATSEACAWRIDKLSLRWTLPCSLARNADIAAFARCATASSSPFVLLVTFAKLLRPRGVRTIVAESLLLKHQLLTTARSRRHAPSLTTSDRFVIALTSLFVNPHRIPKLSAILKPVTLFKFHKALINRKYELPFLASGKRGKPGTKGPAAELIAAIVEMKSRNPKFGCARIAQQISYAFGIAMDKDVVRRVLAKHYRPEPGADGTSWLSLLAHAKDSLWSVCGS